MIFCRSGGQPSSLPWLGYETYDARLYWSAVPVRLTDQAAGGRRLVRPAASGCVTSDGATASLFRDLGEEQPGARDAASESYEYRPRMWAPVPVITARKINSAPSVRYACRGIAIKTEIARTMPHRLSVWACAVAQFLRSRDVGDPDRDRHEQQPGQCGGGATGDLGERAPGFQANLSVCPNRTMNARALAGRIRLCHVPERKAHALSLRLTIELAASDGPAPQSSSSSCHRQKGVAWETLLGTRQLQPQYLALTQQGPENFFLYASSPDRLSNIRCPRLSPVRH